MTKKRVLLVLTVASMMLVACRWNTVVERPTNVVSCNVDPDEVFGLHYTAADFQIWPMADEEMTRNVASKVVQGKGISSVLSGWRVLFANADTAEAGTIASELCAFHRKDDTVCSYGWIPDDFDTNKSSIVIVCGKNPLIDGNAVADAYVEIIWDKPAVVFEFAKEFHSDWKRITKDNIGRCLPIMLGGRILMIPVVNGEITKGKCCVTGLSEDECCALAAILSSRKG